MKNIHVLPTYKPSRLWINNLLQGKLELSKEVLPYNTSRNIYITSDEEIKVGDWYLNIEEKNGIKNPFYGKLYKANESIYKVSLDYLVDNLKKIILTTDQDLIKDGVQAIDDEFLEWFVKNPSCERVVVNNLCYGYLGGFADAGYKIIIPKEEAKQYLEKEMFELEQELDIPSHLRWHNSKPKQKTLEEAANNYSSNELSKLGFIDGAKWQQERMYSEEEVVYIVKRTMYNVHCWGICEGDKLIDFKISPRQWFEQFKNK